MNIVTIELTLNIIMLISAKLRYFILKEINKGLVAK